MTTGRLAIKNRDLVRRLRDDGFEVSKHGKQDRWHNAETKRTVILRGQRGEISGNFIKDIYKQAGWEWSEPVSNEDEQEQDMTMSDRNARRFAKKMADELEHPSLSTIQKMLDLAPKMKEVMNQSTAFHEVMTKQHATLASKHNGLATNVEEFIVSWDKARAGMEEMLLHLSEKVDAQAEKIVELEKKLAQPGTALVPLDRGDVTYRVACELLKEWKLPPTMEIEGSYFSKKIKERNGASTLRGTAWANLMDRLIREDWLVETEKGKRGISATFTGGERIHQ